MTRHSISLYHHAALLTALTSTLVGCHSCGTGPSAPHTDELFIRCAELDPPTERQWRVGALELRVHGRTMEILGTGSPAKLAVVRGAAPRTDPLEPEGALVGAAQIVLVMGGIGDELESARASFEALARLGRPILLLPGARDDRDAWREAMRSVQSGDALVDLSGLREVLIAGTSFVPVPGSPHGRYRGNEAICGWDEEVAETLTNELEPRTPRALLTWAAPAGSPIAAGIDGSDAGSALVASLARALDARSVIAAWPETQAGKVSVVEGGIHLVVPPFSGPLAPRADGSRPSERAFLLEVDTDGIRMATPATETAD